MAESKSETFFPGVRKGLFLDHFVPLATTAGEKRQRIDFVCSLADGQLLGMPEWLTGAVQLVQSGRSKKDVSPVQLDGVVLTCYATATSEKESITIPSSLLKSFVVQPVSASEKASGDVVDIELTFSAYLSWNPSVWAWLVKNYNSTFWAAFGTGQAKLTFGAPKSEADLKKDAEVAEKKGRQGSLLPAMEGKAKPDIPPPAPVEEIADGDASFCDLKNGDAFRYEAARWIKMSYGDAVRQLDPNVRIKFSKATRVTTGAGGPITLAKATSEHDRQLGVAADAVLALVEESLNDGLDDEDDQADRAHEFADDGTGRDTCRVCESYPDAPVHQPGYVKPEDESQETPQPENEGDLPEFGDADDEDDEPSDAYAEDDLDVDDDDEDDGEMTNAAIGLQDDGLDEEDGDDGNHGLEDDGTEAGMEDNGLEGPDDDEDAEIDQSVADAAEEIQNGPEETQGPTTAAKRAAKKAPAKRAAKAASKRAAKKAAKR